ncbi:MAG: MBL fold metallo-hydrolase [Chloroflexi bacterium]|nr:MBL fold metallo-hydrolase [Chloroflexota bacterium]
MDERSFKVLKERLPGVNAELTSFVFRHGANVYVFSYDKDGERKHTLIEAGDLRHRDYMLRILSENSIGSTDIERIIITHCHHDHWGLAALLSTKQKARVLVHSNFRKFVEGEDGTEAQRWAGEAARSQLKECDFEYLSYPSMGEAKSISGVDFPILAKHIGIGEAGELTILACPESTPTHSPDQIVILYSPHDGSGPSRNGHQDLRPTDDIIFTGDLWLMRGPRFDWGIGSLFRRFFMYRLQRIKNFLLGKSTPRRNAREQDSEAKEALKRGFTAIRVKPGHGEEFIGSDIIPKGLLAGRDVLAQLGYSMDANKSILAQSDLAPKIKALREQAYADFVGELHRWIKLGYTFSEISALLLRIHEEQSGGNRLVREDRKERRERLRETLARLRDDKSEPQNLRELAESTLPGLQRD